MDSYVSALKPVFRFIAIFSLIGSVLFAIPANAESRELNPTLNTTASTTAPIQVAWWHRHWHRYGWHHRYWRHYGWHRWHRYHYYRW